MGCWGHCSRHSWNRSDYTNPLPTPHLFLYFEVLRHKMWPYNVCYFSLHTFQWTNNDFLQAIQLLRENADINELGIQIFPIIMSEKKYSPPLKDPHQSQTPRILRNSNEPFNKIAPTIWPFTECLLFRRQMQTPLGHWDEMWSPSLCCRSCWMSL